MDTISKLDKILDDNYIINVNFENNWTAENEKYIKELGEIAYCYSWIHHEIYKKNKLINNILNGFSISSSFLTLLIFFISGDMKKLIILYKIFGGMSFFFSLITSISTYKDSFIKHNELSKEMTYFHKKIYEELSHDPTMRHLVDDYIKCNKSEFERLKYKSSRLRISNKIIENFDIQFSGKQIKKPIFDVSDFEKNILLPPHTSPPSNKKPRIMESIDNIINT